jgi:hypothetical protein
VKREGHSNVPTKELATDAFRLGQWVGNQRSKPDKLSTERRRRLEELPGWSWNARTDQWEKGYIRLKEYVKREGNCLIHPKFIEADGFRLGKWVVSQRTRKNTFSAVRRAQLETLPGWSWAVREDKWEEGYSFMVQFVDRTGDCNVSHNFTTEEGYRLGQWVQTQRSMHNKMSLERKSRLEALPGWLWHVRS